MSNTYASLFLGVLIDAASRRRSSASIDMADDVPAPEGDPHDHGAHSPFAESMPSNTDEWSGAVTTPDATIEALYDKWFSLYHPSRGLRSVWLAQMHDLRNERPFVQTPPRREEEYDTIHRLIFPWNLTMRDDDAYLQLEVNMWLAMYAIRYYASKNGTRRTIHDFDIREIMNHIPNEHDYIDRRVRGKYIPLLSGVWNALLSEGRPLSAREALEIIACELTPKDVLDRNHRLRWWRTLQRLYHLSIGEREDAHKFSIDRAFKRMTRHLRAQYATPQVTGDYAHTLSVFGKYDDNAQVPLREVIEAARRDNNDDTLLTYLPLPLTEDDMHRTFPDDVYLYTENATELNYVGACFFLFARAAVAGIVAPGTFYGGGTLENMGEANLPQFSHIRQIDRIEDVALRARMAALRIVRARRGGPPEHAGDASVIKDVRTALKRHIDDPDDDVRNACISYRRQFAAVLRIQDRLEDGGLRTFAEVEAHNELLGVGTSTPEDDATMASAMRRLAL